MKKRRLKKWVKYLLTAIVIIISIIIYALMAKFGAKSENSIIILIGVLCGWIWLILGQFGAYYFIWES